MFSTFGLVNGTTIFFKCTSASVDLRDFDSWGCVCLFVLVFLFLVASYDSDLGLETQPHRGSHLALSLSTFPIWDLTLQTVFSNNFNPDAEGSKTSLQCCWSFIYLVCRNRIWSWVIIKAVPKARCTYKRIKRCQSAKLKAPGITFKWPDDRRPLLTDYIL